MTHAYLKHWNSEIPFNKALYHSFSHKAMHTQFEIWIHHKDRQYAAQAAHEAFMLVDALENSFSKFIPNSDISRINKAEKDQTIHVDESTFACLQKSMAMYNQTGKAFDISLGTGLGQLYLDEVYGMITKGKKNIKLDLGGIGKGSAVDGMVDLLKDWDIESALVHGGASSVSAYGQTAHELGWPITLSNPWMEEETLYYLDMMNISIGSSGLLKGLHIIKPDVGEPIQENRAVWVSGPDAITTDALSTTFMILTLDEIRSFTKGNQDIDALVLTKINDDGAIAIHPFGKWPI